MWWLVDLSSTNQLLNENSLCYVLSIWIISWSHHAKWPIINVWLLVTSAPNRTKSYHLCIPCSLEISRNPAKIWTNVNYIKPTLSIPFHYIFCWWGGARRCWTATLQSGSLAPSNSKGTICQIHSWTYAHVNSLQDVLLKYHKINGQR